MIQIIKLGKAPGPGIYDMTCACCKSDLRFTLSDLLEQFRGHPGIIELPESNRYPMSIFFRCPVCSEQFEFPGKCRLRPETEIAPEALSEPPAHMVVEL